MKKNQISGVWWLGSLLFFIFVIFLYAGLIKIFSSLTSASSTRNKRRKIIFIIIGKIVGDETGVLENEFQIYNLRILEFVLTRILNYRRNEIAFGFLFRHNFVINIANDRSSPYLSLLILNNF